MYPGANRVGAELNNAVYPAHVPTYDGVDWYWGRSIAGALRFIDEQRPDASSRVPCFIRTGALPRYAVRRGARVILEVARESRGRSEAYRSSPVRTRAHARASCRWY